jgi:hypothetical protein
MDPIVDDGDAVVQSHNSMDSGLADWDGQMIEGATGTSNKPMLSAQVVSGVNDDIDFGEFTEAESPLEISGDKSAVGILNTAQYETKELSRASVADGANASLLLDADGTPIGADKSSVETSAISSCGAFDDMQSTPLPDPSKNNFDGASTAENILKPVVSNDTDDDFVLATWNASLASRDASVAAFRTDLFLVDSDEHGSSLPVEGKPPSGYFSHLQRSDTSYFSTRASSNVTDSDDFHDTIQELDETIRQSDPFASLESRTLDLPLQPLHSMNDKGALENDFSPRLRDQEDGT